MELKDLKDWLLFGTGFLIWAFSLGVVWTRLVDRMEKTKDDLNLIGGRVNKVENEGSGRDGRLHGLELALNEYRRDTQEAIKGLSRVEKGVENLSDGITQGNLQIGVQLHSIEKLIQEKDLRTQTRLVRIETVIHIEEKIGPIPMGE